MSDTSDKPEMRQIDRKKKLGKGLGALLGETRREEPLVRSDISTAEVGNGAAATREGNVEGLASIPVAHIEPLPGQPRTHFDEEGLDCSRRLRRAGSFSRSSYRPWGRAATGWWRANAAQRNARLHEIPALIRELDQREVMALALIENLQREDLNPVEEARAYQKLSEDEGMTQAEIAKLVDKSRSHVANFQRLLALPGTVLAFLAEGSLTMGHARALVGRDEAADLAKKAVSEGLSVREMEALTRKPRKRSPASEKGGATSEPGANADIEAVQGHLEEFLGMPVKITTDTSPTSGAVTIRFGRWTNWTYCQRLTGGDI